MSELNANRDRHRYGAVVYTLLCPTLRILPYYALSSEVIPVNNLRAPEKKIPAASCQLFYRKIYRIPGSTLYHGRTWAYTSHRLVKVISYELHVYKYTFGHVRPAKIQISLRIRAVWSESSLGAFWIGKDAKFLYVENEDSDYTADSQIDLRLRWAHMSVFSF